MNKSKCHRCGLSDRHCRPTGSGYWCQADGLVEDTMIAPSPDEIHEAVGYDEQVIEAERIRDEHQAVYDRADAEWKDALGRLSAAEINSGPTFLPYGPGARQGDELRGKTRRKIEALRSEEDAKRQARDDAAVMLKRAYHDYHAATVEARKRAVAAL